MKTGALRKRVLVTDDEDDVRRLVRVVLERAGHTVLEAPTGRVALWLHHAKRPDLVILDLAARGLRLREEPDLEGLLTLAEGASARGRPLVSNGCLLPPSSSAV